MGKWVIISADDFGRSRQNNLGIIRAFEHGVVTSASMIAHGEAFEEAVIYAKRRPDLDLGVHLSLQECRPMLSRERIPDLTDEAGRFLPPRRLWPELAYAGSRTLDQVRAEWEAQIARLVDAGIRVSHVDGHGHIHVHPRLQGVLTRLQERFGIFAYRAPQESLLRLGSPGRYAGKIFLNLCSRYARVRRDGRFFAPDALHGFMHGGRLSVDILTSIFARMGEGIHEVMTHPGSDNRDEPFGVPYHWEDELNSLLSLDAAGIQARHGFRLVSFREEAGTRR